MLAGNSLNCFFGVLENTFHEVFGQEIFFINILRRNFWSDLRESAQLVPWYDSGLIKIAFRQFKEIFRRINSIPLSNLFSSLFAEVKLRNENLLRGSELSDALQSCGTEKASQELRNQTMSSSTFKWEMRCHKLRHLESFLRLLSCFYIRQHVLRDFILIPDAKKAKHLFVDEMKNSLSKRLHCNGRVDAEMCVQQKRERFVWFFRRNAAECTFNESSQMFCGKAKRLIVILLRQISASQGKTIRRLQMCSEKVRWESRPQCSHADYRVEVGFSSFPCIKLPTSVLSQSTS